MSNDDIVDGPGYSSNGLGTSTIDIKGDAPYSTANGSLRKYGRFRPLNRCTKLKY